MKNYYALDVYSLGKAVWCLPPANINGKVPTFGIIFHDRENVIFLFPLN